MYKITSKICLSGDVGVNNNMFGGHLLAVMDEAAAIYAKQYTGCKRLVTRCFSGVEFKYPIHEGEIYELYADNPKRGKTSFSFDIVVLVGQNRHFSASCVFVAIDENGNKQEIDWSKARELR